MFADIESLLDIDLRSFLFYHIFSRLQRTDFTVSGP
jgi:hypothetical protein